MLASLIAILAALLDGSLTVAEAIAALAGLGIDYLGQKTINALGQFIRAKIGGTNVACATTHKTSATVQGPGVCCAALTASGLPPTVGLRVAAVNKKGKCIVCEVKASTSVKHPGALVFKRGKAHVPGSAVSCPSSSEGCCALAAA